MAAPKEDRQSLFPMEVYLGIAAVAAVVLFVIGLVVYCNSREIDADSYVVLRGSAEMCPPIRARTLAALQARPVSRSAFNGIIERRDELGDTYAVAAQRDDAIRRLGGKGLALPVECDNPFRGEVHAAANLVHENDVQRALSELRRGASDEDTGQKK